MSIWGNPVMLGGSGGGGGDVPLLSRAAWNALSIAQKQAYGLVAIQDANSGFDRGELVYGAEYVPIGQYLPASDPSKIICDAYVANFASDDYWGMGDSPIALQAGLNPAISTAENAVYLGVAATGKFAYVNLGAEAAAYTAYAVLKLVSPGAYTRLISSMAARTSGRGMLLFGSNVNVSSWASDTSTGVSSTSYIAVALQYNGSDAGAGMVKSNGTYITKTPFSSAQYLTVGRTDINADTSNAEPANLYLRYLGVSTDYETEAQIRSNLANLESVFIS